LGFCKPKVGDKCGTGKCSACVLGADGFATCGAFNSLCVNQGGRNGTEYGCNADQFCFNNLCNDCTTTGEPGEPIMCGSGKFSVNFKVTNPNLQIRVCASDTNEVSLTCSTQARCQLSWMPGSGIGVDCMTADTALTGRYNESLTITIAPPLTRRFGITFKFGGFLNGIDSGKMYVTYKPASGGRRRQTEPITDVLIINSDTFLLNDTYDQISSLEIFAEGDSAFTLDSIDTASLYVKPADTTTTLTTTMSTMPSATSLLTTTTTLEETTESAVGFLDRIANGFAGKDDSALGFTIGAIVLIVICIIACVVIGIAVARKRRAQSQLMSAYGEGKPMQSFETVTAKPSTALRDGSDDESPFGSNLNASNGSVPTGGIKVEPLTDSDE